jgi:hypothetical protein
VISFRYHIVSLIAVFLALAVGIVVGTTALSGPITTDLRNQVNSLKGDRADLSKEVKQLQSQIDDAGQFAASFGPQLVAGTLKNTNVLLVDLPGASSGMADGIATQLAAAGAQITGRLQLAHDFVDPAGATSISSLATNTSARPLGLTLPVTSDARLLGSALLSYVLLGKGQPSDLRQVLSGFSALHMITSDPKGIEPATYIVVVANGSLPKEGYAGAAELDLVTALQQRGGKVVVAGDAGTAAPDGVIALVRSGAAKATVSTVDNADTAFGQVSTVLALAGTTDSRIGHYGTATGADALFPSPNG